MILLFLFPFLCLAQSECIVNGTDYSSVTREKDFFNMTIQLYEFIMNICGTVNDDDDAVIAREGNDKYISLGKYSTQQPISDNYGEGFKYTGGTTQGGNSWSSIIYIKCDQNMTEDKVTAAHSNIDYLNVAFMIQGPGVCPVEKQSSSSISISSSNDNENNSSSIPESPSNNSSFLEILLPILIVIIVICLIIIIVCFIIIKKKRNNEQQYYYKNISDKNQQQNEDIFET